MGYIQRNIGRGNMWSFFIGLGFIIWGILHVVYPNTVEGSKWLFLPGGILLLSSIGNIFAYRYNREKVLGALQSYQRINMSELSEELKMTEKNVKEIIVDLRTEGRLKASFDPESGDVIVLEVRGQPPAGVELPEPQIDAPVGEMTASMKSIKSQGYCPYCGIMVKTDDKFCNNCGAALE